ncbi:hypothetical protein [Pseudoxanthomonas sp. JBR18]|uniref:hypothetical protein n=1 Tax=Pseudoxanthomonas sp. JBR18 TaxID=2969308 RepID=UPI00230576D4|nr:hypothetical protein [Pseudoxanthomonas sp. JBR18]WCE02946.1 hypothetical protein PJ250_12470 [Pseudoxanthomonas sp. JBR18]
MPRALRYSLPASVRFLPLHAAAQQAAPATDLRQQMRPSAFKAADLDRLGAGELAHLNAWPNHSVDTQSAATATPARADAKLGRAEVVKAREAGREEVSEENRHFVSFVSEEPIKSTISDRFEGFDKGCKWTFANGQAWRQVDSAALVSVRCAHTIMTIQPDVRGA